MYITVLSDGHNTGQVTRNAWQSLAYSPLGVVVSPPTEYL